MLIGFVDRQSYQDKTPDDFSIYYFVVLYGIKTGIMSVDANERHRIVKQLTAVIPTHPTFAPVGIRKLFGHVLDRKLLNGSKECFVSPALAREPRQPRLQ